jgi:hypothetical protein
MIASNFDFFPRKFAPRCCVCQNPIMPEPGQDETIRVVALDRSFHINCYKCEVSSRKKANGSAIKLVFVSILRTADFFFHPKLKVAAVIHSTITFYAKTATPNEFRNSQAASKASSPVTKLHKKLHFRSSF